MTRIIVDEILRTGLHNLSEPLDLYDESGRILARVTPLADLSQYEPWEPAFDEKDLRQQEERNEKRYSTAEVLAHLHKSQEKQ